MKIGFYFNNARRNKKGSVILMNDEFDELYNMLSLDREDVRKLKDDYEKDISILINRVRNYHTNNFDLSKEYDVENNFDKYRLDETFLNYNIANDVLEFKINLLQGMLQDLFVEKIIFPFLICSVVLTCTL